MAEPYLIKKYPNRRLYDTEESRYITLSDVQTLVRQDKDIQVIDSQSGNDITRSILIQIITEQEASGNPLFTTEILTRFIRFYDESVQDAFSSFLHQTLQLYAEQQTRMRAQMDELIPDHNMVSWSDIADKNLQIWREMQESFFKAAGFIPPGADRGKGKK